MICIPRGIKYTSKEKMYYGLCGKGKKFYDSLPKGKMYYTIIENILKSLKPNLNFFLLTVEKDVANIHFEYL